MLGLVPYILDKLSGCVTHLKNGSIYLGIANYHYDCNPHILILQSMYIIYLFHIFVPSLNGLKDIQLLPNVSVSMKEVSGRGTLGKIVFSGTGIVPKFKFGEG